MAAAARMAAASSSSTIWLAQVILATVITIASTQETTQENYVCPDDFKQYGSICFHQSDAYISINEARSYCASRSGTLPNPGPGGLDQWQRAIVDANIGSFRWAGASAREDGSWAWSDRTSVQRNAWGPGEISIRGLDIPANWTCSAVNYDGTLGFTSCLPALPVLCQRDITDISSFIEEDPLQYSRNAIFYPSSSEKDKKEALAYVRQLNYIPEVSPLSSQKDRFQGDIIFRSYEDFFELFSIPKSKHHVTRRLAPHEKYDKTWPKNPEDKVANIPYCISKDYSMKQRVLFEGAMGLINEAVPCLKFTDRENCKKNGGEDFLNFMIKGRDTFKDECSSEVGRIKGGQNVFLAEKCFTDTDKGEEFIGTVIHELIHAAGFYHEFSRSDRDTHIKVLNTRLLKIHNQKLLPLPYDYESVMHYAGQFGNGIEVIKNFEARNSPDQKIPGPTRIPGSTGMKPLDVLALKLLYDCPDASFAGDEECTDNEEVLGVGGCKHWKDNGGCTDFPQYKACQKTCDFCETTPAPTQPPITDLPPTLSPKTTPAPTQPPITYLPPILSRRTTPAPTQPPITYLPPNLSRRTTPAPTQPPITYLPPNLSPNKPGACPAVRARCPEFFISDAPVRCTVDTGCPGAEKCCYDECLKHNTCKDPQ